MGPVAPSLQAGAIRRGEPRLAVARAGGPPDLLERDGEGVREGVGAGDCRRERLGQASGPLALRPTGDVANDRRVALAFGGGPRAQGELERKLAAVLAQTLELDRDPPGEQPLALCDVTRVAPFGSQVALPHQQI